MLATHRSQFLGESPIPEDGVLASRAQPAVTALYERRRELPESLRMFLGDCPPGLEIRRFRMAGRDIVTLVPDVVLPVAVYYACRWSGMDEETSLSPAAAAALVRVLMAAAVERRFNGLAALVCAGFAIGLLLALLTGHPRYIPG
ncbi:hypothetical protein ITP53_00865 [Nonomuraea sp. K274]|uniref:Uncharacterized protein n=1 Tax=Nonomuraea cypriaca TaxID=1187855 RepID=A0A931A3I1_9ACTN|nr:hypothetical protein [Nonomuraea cypriaca]MBF8184320.1 hypothetical protein [Nonomuraea cypriaca]